MRFHSRCLARRFSALAMLLPACAGQAPPVACAEPRVTGRLPSELAEGSGIAPATQSADRAWAITDGGPPLLFAIDSTGSIVSRVAVRNADKYDWEALASARCAAGTCLYIGDVGDNQRDRSTVRVYRVSEPAANAGTTEAADRFDFRYPDGAHDAEAIFVLPGEQLYVVTKGRSEPISVYRYPGALTRDSVVTLDLVQTLTRSFVQLPDMVTGAGTTPDGQWIVLRTYGAVQLYRLHDGRLRQELPDPISLQALHEFQGEGADLRGDGEILLLSEKGLDEGNPPISRMKCTLPPDLR